MMKHLAILLLACSAMAQVQEKMTVERVLIDARVTQKSGDPITGLTKADFNVRIDNKPAQIESVDWISDLAEPSSENTVGTGFSPSQSPSRPAGRLLLFFFQTDFGRAKWRVTGQMKLLQTAEYLEMIRPGDRVAVLSYDSRLKFRLDFTDDKKAIKEAMNSSLYIDDPPRPPKVASPSLAEYLRDDDVRHKTDTIGDGVTVLAEALRNIPGPKSLIFFSWGIGQVTQTGVYMDQNYGVARWTLDAARVSVYSIDFTQADSHDLSLGLSKIADDSGGFYASTFQAPQFAAVRLARTLTGHYELEVRKPEATTPGTMHAIRVTTRRKGALIMARGYFFDEGQ